MHPVNYLFDEIMRHYWGMPQQQLERPSRREREVPAWRLPRYRRRDDAR
jgi:hypothetical protein